MRSEIRRYIDRAISGKLWSSGHKPPAINTIFNRIHAKNGKFKFRFIFAPNWEVTVLETILGGGLIDALVSSNSSAVLIGKTQLDVSARMRELTGYHVYCFDYRKFDQTVPTPLIRLAGETVRQLLPDASGASGENRG